MGEVIAIASQKGGVGKTTTAVNLGACLASLGYRVILLDLDPQGSVASSFGFTRYDVNCGILDVFFSNTPIEKALHPTGMPGFEFIPSNIWSDENERRQLAGLSSRDQLREKLVKLRTQVDFILIDCPPSLGNLTLNALVAADSLVVPVQCEYYALKALGRFLKFTRIIKQEYNPQLRYRGFLLTMVDARNKLTKIVIEKVRYTLKGLIFDTMIPRNIRLAEVPYHGRPVIMIDRRCKGSQSHLDLALEILGIQGRGSTDITVENESEQFILEESNSDQDFVS